MKKVISVHDSREEADQALENRKKELGRKVWECNTRIVWVEGKIDAGDSVKPGQYSTWRSDEKIPYVFRGYASPCNDIGGVASSFQ